MPFKKGRSGNPKGAPKKGETLRAWLERVGQQRNEKGITWDEALIQALFVTAIAGNVAAARLILESRLGKPPVMAPDALDPAASPEAHVKLYLSVSPDDWPDP